MLKSQSPNSLPQSESQRKVMGDQGGAPFREADTRKIIPEIHTFLFWFLGLEPHPVMNPDCPRAKQISYPMSYHSGPWNPVLYLHESKNLAVNFPHSERPLHSHTGHWASVSPQPPWCVNRRLCLSFLFCCLWATLHHALGLHSAFWAHSRDSDRRWILHFVFVFCCFQR